MKRLCIGPCPLCSTQIWETEEIMMNGKKFKRTVMNSKGTHFYIFSNYKSIMAVAICKDCLKDLDDAKVAQITDNVVWTWFLEIAEDKDMSEEKRRIQFNKIRFYVSLKWGRTEDEVKDAS